MADTFGNLMMPSGNSLPTLRCHQLTGFMQKVSSDLSCHVDHLCTE